MRFLVALLLIAGVFPCSAVEISNFKAGLACTNTKITKDGAGWVCQQTQDILVTDQGSCVYNGKTKPCTWIGFEFDYKSSEENTKLQCVGETSLPSSPGNPREVLAQNVRSQSYELELPGKAGHFYNPMYYIFAVRSLDDSVVVDTLTCKANGVVLFQSKFNLHFPASTE